MIGDTIKTTRASLGKCEVMGSQLSAVATCQPFLTVRSHRVKSGIVGFKHSLWEVVQDPFKLLNRYKWLQGRGLWVVASAVSSALLVEVQM